MALKALLDNIDDLAPEVAGEYEEKEIDGKKVFVLSVEGVESHPRVKALKSAHDRQKEDNRKLKQEKSDLETKLKDFPEEFTLDEWHRLQALDDVDPNDPDAEKKRKEKQDERLATAKRQFEQQITTLKQQLDDEKAAHDTTRSTERSLRANDNAERELSEALTKAGVKPSLVRAAKALLRNDVKHEIEEDGSLRIFVHTDLGDHSVEEYVSNWAKSDEGKDFVVPPSGGGAGGNGRNQGGADLKDNPFTQQFWNKTQQSQMARVDASKAERLAKSAGFKDLAVAIAARTAIVPAK